MVDSGTTFAAFDTAIVNRINVRLIALATATQAANQDGFLPCWHYNATAFFPEIKLYFTGGGIITIAGYGGVRTSGWF